MVITPGRQCDDLVVRQDMTVRSDDLAPTGAASALPRRSLYRYGAGRTVTLAGVMGQDYRRVTMATWTNR
jgi:hypothetical protein